PRRRSSCSSARRGSSSARGSSRARIRPGWRTRSSRRRPTSTIRRASPRSRRAWEPRCGASPSTRSRRRSGWPSEAGRGRSSMKIAVLALQGDFGEHIQTLESIGVEGVPVRLPADLDGVSGLILPGGESTTMRQLIQRWGLVDPIRGLAATGTPLFGTCAGMIVLSKQIVGGDPPVLPLLDVSVERNAFGRQLDSFEADLTVPVLGDTPVHAVFIRAPVIEAVG